MQKLTIAILLLSTSFFFSCKKCDSSNHTSGMVLENAVVKVKGGSISDKLFINSPSDFDGEIQMSLDGGETYVAVDYSKYSVFAQRTTASCSSGYTRNVYLDKKNNIVNYNIIVEECDDCEKSRTTNNWVLTSKVPNTFTPLFSVKYQ